MIVIVGVFALTWTVMAAVAFCPFRNRN